jgi:hypothetical protein
MNNRSFIILICIVLVMVGLLYMQPADFDQRPQQLIFPELAGALNDVNRITVTGAGDAAIATLTRGDEFWTLAERGDHRADVGRIRRNLIALSDARVVEVKTADPALHARLGVEDLSASDASGKSLVIEAPDETFELIIGATGVRGKMAYARRPGADQSFLISADLDLGDAPVDWLQRDLMDIEAGRVHSITLTHADGETLRIERPARNADELNVVGMPPDRELQYATILDSTAGVLSGLRFDDVARDDVARDDAATPESAVVARFETFDGLVVTATLTGTDDRKSVRFAAAASEELAARFAADEADADSAQQLSFDAVGDEARTLSERVNGWTYELPSFKTDQLGRRLEDLLQPPE